MVDPISIKHAFVLTKPNSPDASIVSTNAWNAEEKITGGQDGQLMARNSAVASGGSFVHGPRAQTALESFSSAGATSTAPLATVTATFTSNCDVVFLINIAAIISVGNSVIMAIRRDGVDFITRQIRSAGNDWYGFHETAVESPGSHTYSVVVSVTSGVITQATAKLTVMPFGRL